MTRSNLQLTRFNRAIERLVAQLLGNLRGNWRLRSSVVLALLLGFYAGSNLTAYVLLHIPGGRPMAVLTMVLLVELVVRVRGRLVRATPGLGWVLVDNLRIGMVYAVVIEAFKLGT
ncbi:DUF565 domain-containing protein [Cyanobium sp. BA5m-21]|uniref:DUF565 domain-containing protein n=1 Tax=unclassified Cyanobium TaxID=2627006 RepID=UPI0020CBCE6A|nr:MULTISPECIES: DUF565 domain-containing protein [unclassified Cyanobium]MCP9903696.1 DUF565 domain-containing protein [Cyanobium sp. BA5m-10]MCP9906818.1 DUF565 domain-containing protein [Cyanobium sp. BA5m-21]